MVADRDHPPATPTALGPVKWRHDAPFTRADGAELMQARAAVPGATASLIAVSRTGGDAAGIGTLLTPQDLMAGAGRPA